MSLLKKIASEIPVNTITSSYQGGASVAPLTSGGFVVVWADNSGIGGDPHPSAVKAQIFDSTGAKVGDEFLVNSSVVGSQWMPSVTGLAGGGFAVAWTSSQGDGSGYAVMGRLFHADGTAATGEFLVNNLTNLDQSVPSVFALASGGFAIAWSDQSGGWGTNDIRAQLFDAAGQETGPELLVNTTTQGMQGGAKGVALASGHFVVTWTDAPAGGGEIDIRAQIFDSTGTPVGGEILVNTVVAGTQLGPAIAALPNGGFVIGWQSLDFHYQAKIQIFDASGGKVGGETLVSAPGAAVHNVSINTLATSGFFVSWADKQNPFSHVQTQVGQLFDLDGNKLGGQSRLNESEVVQGAALDTVVLASGRIAAVWEAPDYSGSDLRAQLLQPPLVGTSAAEVFAGTAADDVVMVHHGGEDTVQGNEGDDGLYFGAALDAADSADGGNGFDQLGLQGDYSGGYTFSESNLLNIEMIVLISGTDTRFADPGGSLYSYDLTTIDANVGAGQQLYISFNMLQAGENVVFDGSAETDGSFRTSGGLGNDVLTGGAQDDGFYFGAQGRWGAGDKVDGGPGGTMDQLGLHGLYAGATAISFAADQLIGIEMIVLLTGGDTRFGSGGLGYSYDLTMHDANVLSGQQMVISANTLRADETLTFNGSAETDGSFAIYAGEAADTLVGSAGADILSGRGGADTMTGGAGDDHFLYSSAAHSTAAARDHILDFASGDKIDLSRIDAIPGGGDDAFTFVGAAAFTGTAGELRAVRNGPEWIVEGDLDGDGLADFALSLYRVDGLGTTAADFIL